MGLRVVTVHDGEVGHDTPLLISELVRCGLDVHVVCAPRDTGLFPGTGVTGLAVGTGIAALAALRRTLTGDVVHAHGLRAGIAAVLARTGGTPLVLSWSGPAPAAGASGLVGRALIRTLVPATAAVLAATPDLVAAATQLGMREAVHLPPPRPPAWPVTRTPEQVREELALPEGPIVLAHAPLSPSARLDVLIDAAARWRRPGGPQVVLAGVGPAYRQLVARAVMARAPVTFAGDRAFGPAVTRTAAETDERAALPDLIAAATLAVVTDAHARPEFALRAAQAGVPIVAPERIAALVGDGAVPAGDVDALDAAVTALLDDPARRAGLGARAQARLADWPDAAAVAARLVEVYERVGVARSTG